jgi:endonuclease YncB( thermonuclease family)
MRKVVVRRGLLALVMLGATLGPSWAGDSLYGRVTAVKGPTLVTLDYGEGSYDIRLVGIEAPRGEEARQFLSNLVLGKNARMRLHHRGPNNELVCRLFTDDAVIGIKEVSVLMLREGLARRIGGYDEKYGELAAAENEAKAAGRGIWAPASK